MKHRVTAIATACLLVTAGAFVVLHSGGPGDAACERSRFAPSSGFSAWPPGVRCEFGEPAQTDVIVNYWFAFVVVAVAVAGAVAYGAARDARG